MIALSRGGSWLIFGGLIWLAGLVFFVAMGKTAKRADVEAEAMFEALSRHPSTGPHEINGFIEDDFDDPSQMRVIRADGTEVHDWETNGDFS